MSIKIQENISLSKYTSFKIGGAARYFCAVENIKEIEEALEFAQKNKLKTFVLGGGSNLLISDKGFNGLVIKMQDARCKMQTNNEIFIGSGYFLAKLVSESVKNNLTGLEWAAGIPGTVGGAVCNNAGSFGKCMGDIIKEVEVLKIEKGLLMADPSKAEKSGNREAKKRKLEIIKLYKKQCQFSYRNSMFKEEKKYVILSAVLKLEKGNGAKSRGVIFRYLKSRVEKQPLKYPSAGSVFINPILNDNQIEKLIKRNSELNNICKNNVIPVGWFVEKLQLKGKKIGGAIISEKHGNFIVNTDNAKAEDVVILISIIKQKVRSKFEVQLKEEIEYVGF